MDQLNSEKQPASRGVLGTLWAMVALGLVVLLLFIGYSHLPSAGKASKGTTSDLVTPTPVQTNPVGALQVNRTITFSGVNITVLKVGEAGKFSDDKKNLGNYTVRVYIQAINKGGMAAGIDYAGLARLQLPDGHEVAPQVVGIAPVVLPNQTQTGYVDFPLANQLDLSSLTLLMGKKMHISFGA
ncbi:MAG: hypothetical protein H0W02_23235 [Ktedonobacteraceae bacterium]|nr:hypothetical protein [Ktedonobacteraceae bacterium]